MSEKIIVRGEGEARATPDRALVNVKVEGEGVERDAAYSEAGELARQVDEVLNNYADAIERTLTATLAVQPKTRWRKGETVRTGWHASRATVLEVMDFARLGELIADLVAAGGAVSGPFWQLDATSPVHGEARRLAAEDARRRGHDYAEALGLGITAIVWVAEPGLRKGHDAPMMRHAAASYASPTSAGAEDEIIDVTPDEMTVSASIEVAFSFESQPR